MRTIVLACLGVALTATAATAGPGTCVALTDAAGDQIFTPWLAGVPGAPDALDLRAADVVASAGGVTAVFTTTGAPTPAPGTAYHYYFTFEDADALYTLHAHLAGVDLGAVPFSLTVDQRAIPGGSASAATIVPVTGSVDAVARTVTVTAPASAFGATDLAGRSWDAVSATSGFGVTRFSMSPSDTVAAGTALVAGDGTCA